MKIKIYNNKSILTALSIFLLEFSFLMNNFFRQPTLSFVFILLSTIFLYSTVFKQLISRRHLIILISTCAMFLVIPSSFSINIVFIILFIFAINSLGNIDDVFKYSIWGYYAILCIVFLSLMLGIVDNTIFYLGGRIRYDLGFININNFPSLWISFFCIYFLYSEKKFMPIMFLLMLSFIIYRFTDTRTAFFASLLIVFIYYLMKYMNRRFLKIGIYLFVTILFFSVFLFFIYDFSDTNSFLNILLSDRLYYFQKYIESQDVVNYLLGGGSGEIDNCFLLIFCNFGIVIYLFVFLRVLKTVKLLLNFKEFDKLAFIIVMLASASVESVILRPQFMSTVVFWYIIVFYKKKNITAFDINIGSNSD